jgi:hypothetical protein
MNVPLSSQICQINKFSRRDLHNYILLRFYIHTPFWGLLLKYNVIRKL